MFRLRLWLWPTPDPTRELTASPKPLAGRRALAVPTRKTVTIVGLFIDFQSFEPLGVTDHFWQQLAPLMMMMTVFIDICRHTAVKHNAQQLMS